MNTMRRTRSEHEPPEQYLILEVNRDQSRSVHKTYSMTIHRLDPFKNEPWYLFITVSIIISWGKYIDYFVTCGESNCDRIWISC